MIRSAVTIIALMALSTPLLAKDSLGVYSNWAAFRDDTPQRCYAIAKPSRSADSAPFASVATWPDRGIRGQLHIRLSRSIRDDSEATLTLGNRSFTLAAKARNAWAKDNRMDAAIIAAMRSAKRMRVAARDTGGNRFSDRYDLTGVATAIDAAIVGCAR